MQRSNAPEKNGFNKSNEELLKQLEAPPLRVEESAAYTFSVLLSLAVLLTLPLIYLGTVAGLVWLIWSLAAAGAKLPGAYWPLTGIFWFVAAVGVAILLAIVKPIVRVTIAIFSSKEEPVVLTEEQFPLLHAAVSKLSESLAAPMPQQIYVDLDVGASAGPRSLLGGFFRQNSVLRLGLPLVYGMNVRQFLGVVAHEMGHFAQSGGGSDLTLFVRLFNFWLADLALNADRFDVWLAKMAHSNLLPLRIIFWPPHFCVVVARRFFFLLKLAGHAASCFECRQKEFDADRYASYISGSDAFATMMMQVHLIDVAHSHALDDFSESWQDERLPDNLPAVIASRATQIPAEKRRQLARLVLTRRTAWYETHPSEAERISASRQLAMPGVLSDERPATVLFSGLDDLAREVTIRRLKLELGDDFAKADIVPAETIIREQEETDEAYDSLRRYFQGEYQLARPLLPAPVAAKPPEKPQQALDELKAARNAMVKASKTIGTSLKEYEILDRRLMNARQAQTICAAGFRIDPGDFELEISHGTAPAVDQAVEQLNYEFEQLQGKFGDYDHAARVRLTRSLQLLHVPAVQQRFDGDTAEADRQQAKKFIGICQALKEVHEQVRELAFQVNGVLTLVGVDPRHMDRHVARKMKDQISMAAGWVGNIRKSLADVPYPFEHARGEISAAEFVVPKQPAEDDLAEVVVVAMTARERFASLLARTVARLTMISERVESAVGFKQLTAPDGQDKVEDFVQQCEAEAQRQGSLSHRMTSAASLGVQVGMTLGLAALVVAGFVGFAAVVRSQDVWMAKLTELQQQDRSRRRRSSDGNQSSAGSSNASSHKNQFGDRTPGGDQMQFAYRYRYSRSGDRSHFSSLVEHYEGDRFTTYGGYSIELPPNSPEPEIAVRAAGSMWAVQYRWHFEGLRDSELKLTIIRNPAYPRYPITLAAREADRAKYGGDIVRVGRGYYVRGALMQTHRLGTANAKVFCYAHDNRHGVLMFDTDGAMRWELQGEVDREHAEGVFPVLCEVARSMRLPAGGPSETKPPTSLATAGWPRQDDPFAVYVASRRPIRPAPGTPGNPVNGGEPSPWDTTDPGSETTNPSPPISATPVPLGATIRELALSSDGGHAACADSRGRIHYFQPGDVKPRATFAAAKNGSIGHLAISHQGRLIAGWTTVDRELHLYSPPQREHVKLLVKNIEPTVLRFSPDGKLLAAGVNDRLLLWDATEAKPLQMRDGLSGSVESLDFSPNNQYILMGLSDGAVVSWDREADKIIFNETQHEGRVRNVAFSPDGSVLLSTAEDNTMIWWNAATARPAAVKNVPARHAGFVLPEATRVLVYKVREISIYDLRRGGIADSHSFSQGGLTAFSQDSRRMLFTKGVVDNLSSVELWQLSQ